MWNKEELLSVTTKIVKIDGKDLKIRRLKASEILVDDKDEDKKFLPLLVSRSLVEPKLSYEEALQIDAKLIKMISDAIMEENGMTPEAQETLKK